MDVQKVLEKLASQNLIRLNKITGDYYSIYCPFHNDGNERKPSFGVLLKEQIKGGHNYPEGFAHCFACGYAKSLPDMITDLLKGKNISKSGLDWLSENVEGFQRSTSDFEYLVPGEMVNALNSKFAVDYINKMKKPDTNSFVSEEELASYRYTVPYMYDRKLTDDIIARFDVGYDANWVPPGRSKAVPCITLPVRDVQGRTLFICRRSIQGKLYNYPEGILKPLYGLDMLTKNTKSVIIVESIINCLTLWSWGYESVALLGTGNSFQMDQLKSLGLHDYVIATDGDEAGRRSAMKLKRRLNSIGFVWIVHMPDGKDVNDLDQDEFRKLYSERD